MSFLPLIGRSVEDTHLEERPRQEDLRRQTQAQVWIPGTRPVYFCFIFIFWPYEISIDVYSIYVLKFLILLISLLLSRAVKFSAKLMGKALARRVKCTILYATETGKSERFARSLCEIFKHAFDAKVRTIHSYHSFHTFNHAFYTKVKSWAWLISQNQ